MSAADDAAGGAPAGPGAERAGERPEAGELSGRERQRVLVDWNDTSAEFPHACAHELFERQVARDRAALAVVCQGRELTYGELDERANRLAHRLRVRGVGPDTLVGVCLERSPELVIALLAVWKAGGAYVPIDPSYPQDRVAFMVGDSDARVLLADEKSRPLFPEDGRVICVDSDWPSLASESAETLEPAAVPSNLAYVMYTSGSTGRPKGAMIEHRGLVNYLWWAIRAYDVRPGASVPVHSSISFDLTVTSLYAPLLAGGWVEILPDDVGAQNLVAALRRRGDRGLVKLTPAHLEIIGQQLSTTEVAGRTRVFVIGGENLLAETLRVWRDEAAGTRLVNEYGPTETVVGCCVHEVNPRDPRSGSIPIGRPIANTRLYVLDEELRPVPVGAMGELYIGGAGVARGYLNRPELTRQRFLPDPFSAAPGGRLYRTGDLARYRPDGTLEYLGRTDDQVKVRGYRIELGEIEATLAAEATVLSCAVLAREDTPGNKQLVAYVVRRDGAVDADALRRFASERLPEHMAPAHFVFLDALPLTPNGKVDRKALPAPSRESAAAPVKGGEPRSELEKALAAIWCDLLKLPAVGLEDDFFDLGGHSLLAIAVVSRVRDALDVELEIRALFENSTLRGLTAIVEGLTQAKQRQAAGGAEVAPAAPRLQRLARRAGPPRGGDR